MGFSFEKMSENSSSKGFRSIFEVTTSMGVVSLLKEVGGDERLLTEDLAVGEWTVAEEADIVDDKSGRPSVLLVSARTSRFPTFNAFVFCDNAFFRGEDLLKTLDTFSDESLWILSGIPEGSLSAFGGGCGICRFGGAFGGTLNLLDPLVEESLLPFDRAGEVPQDGEDDLLDTCFRSN